MKQILRPKYLPYLVLLFSVLGFLLRLRTFGSGKDSDGLYQPQPLVWVLLAVVSIAVVALIFITVARLKNNGSFSDNFPPSLISAIGCAVGAAGMLSSALEVLTAGDSLSNITGILGIAAAIGLAIAAAARLKGKPPFFLCHVAVSLYLGLQIFNHSRLWGNESQVGVFMFPLLALIFAMLASYHLATFDVDMGVRKTSLFWSLSAAYLCTVTLADRSEPLLFGSLAVWLFTNLCSLRPIKKTAPTLEELPEDQPQDDRPMTLEEIDQQMDLK